MRACLRALEEFEQSARDPLSSPISAACLVVSFIVDEECWSLDLGAGHLHIEVGMRLLAQPHPEAALAPYLHPLLPQVPVWDWGGSPCPGLLYGQEGENGNVVGGRVGVLGNEVLLKVSPASLSVPEGQSIQNQPPRSVREAACQVHRY